MIEKTLDLMQQIVEKKVKHYKTDFYDYDVTRIREGGSEQYVWIVRESGTFLCKFSEVSNIYDYYVDNRSVDFYLVNTENATITKIPFAEREHLDSFQVIYKCRDDVFAHFATTISARDKTACEHLAGKWMPDGYDHFEIYN